MRQRNPHGYPLNSPDAGRQIAAFEEFEHPALITGCVPVEPPGPAEDRTPGSGDADGRDKPAKTSSKKAPASKETVL